MSDISDFHPDDCCAIPPESDWRLTRRSLLGGLAASVGVATFARRAAPAAPLPAAFQRYGLSVHPRSEWGADLVPKTAMNVEKDVRLLLVHHTVTSNQYAATAVPKILRGIHSYHTGKVKGWPDIAYSFFVDKYGEVWEGRTGSLQAAVEGSATGGNQGFSRLCCLLGDFGTVTPPKAMVDSLVKLLATLADIHGVATAPGSIATFTSRGSNRWAAGTTVRVPTISGHRACSQTTCPGDAAFVLLPTAIPTKVTALRATAR